MAWDRILRALAGGDRLWAIPWPCCYEFLSVVTNRRIWGEHASTPPPWAATASALVGSNLGMASLCGAARRVLSLAQ